MATFFKEPYIKYYSNLTNTEDMSNYTYSIGKNIENMANEVGSLSSRINSLKWSESGQKELCNNVLPLIAFNLRTISVDISSILNQAVSLASNLYSICFELKNNDEKYEKSKKELISIKASEPPFYSDFDDEIEALRHIYWNNKIIAKENDIIALEKLCRDLQLQADNIVKSINLLSVSDLVTSIPNPSVVSATSSISLSTKKTSLASKVDSIKSILTVNGKNNLNGNVIDVSSPVGEGAKYNLSYDDLAFLGYVAMREQGSVMGAKLELSLMANLYEKNKARFSSVKDYVARSGWFSKNSTNYKGPPSKEYIDAAREVLNDGKRYLASNVVEHDWLGDITSISTGSVKNRSDYVPLKTVIKNRFGAKYMFVGFAPNGGDPFGYLI